MANADGAVPAPPKLRDFRPETLRGAPGFFRVGQTHAGRWWLIDPDDRAFFSRGVDGVAQTGPLPPSPESFPPMEETLAIGSVEPTVARLHAWHVNTVGPGSAPEFVERGFASTEILECVKVAPHTTIRLGGAHVPDVFDPAWGAACQRQAAERCAPGRDRARLIGYFTDHELNWAQPSPAGGAGRDERPSLLQICLSLEPSFPAYHAAWEFALAAHGGDWAALVRAWDTDLANKHALRLLTLADTPLTGPGYRRDQERFAREFARRYFSVTADAIRRHDPRHLILGCRFGAAPAAAILAECVAPCVDVVSCNAREPALAERVDAEARAQGMPVWLGAFSWAGVRASGAGGLCVGALDGSARRPAAVRVRPRPH
jgi:hypothetical protein